MKLAHVLLSVALFAVAIPGTRANDSFREVYFNTADGGIVYANLYGSGEIGVVLAHGAVFNKESWDPLARKLAEKGYMVLAIDFRGYGKSKPGKEARALYEDVLAAVRYLRKIGAKRIAVIGGSMGGRAAAMAAVNAKEGEIDQLILLSPAPIATPEKIKGDKLFIVSKDEQIMPLVKEQFEKAPEPKKLIVLEGSAHAQHIFKSPQGERLTHEILNYLGKLAEKKPAR